MKEEVVLLWILFPIKKNYKRKQDIPQNIPRAIIKIFTAFHGSCSTNF